MTKNTIITALFALAAVAGQAQVRYQLEGAVGDSTMNTTLLLYQQMSAVRMVNSVIDTVQVVSGRLQPKQGMLDEPGVFDLRSVTERDGQPEIMSPCFILENGTTHLYVDLGNQHLGQDAVRFLRNPSGTPLNEEWDKFVNAHASLPYGDSARQQRLDSLVRSELSRHGDDVLGMLEIAMLFAQVPPQQVASWLNLMSPRIKAGEVWGEMTFGLQARGMSIEKMEPYYSPAVGEPFKDFAVEYDGKTTRLSDYVGRGQYVLVDFWASWCGPCRREIPNLIAAYEKYKDRGLIVLGIAAWEKPEATQRAIEEEQMPYPQIINSQKIATDLYGIHGIPEIILFSPDGTILARGLRSEEIDRRLVEIFSETKQ